MYEHFFGLEDEPFRLTPDPRYLYLSPKHAEALAHLRLGLTDSSGFVCITGEVGTGKTTLVRTFLAELGPNVSAAYIFVPPTSALELLRSVCREFGCFVAGLSQIQLVEELHGYLVEQHKAGRICVVVIDEAQALPIDLLEQLRLLLNLETETQKLLRIVLVGQPQLRRLLLDPNLAQLNQRITLRWHLGPLTSRETVAYVSHRLSVASGGRSVDLFTRPALRLLHSVAAGVPRLINMVGHRALLAAFIDRQARVNRRWVAQAYREIQAVPLPGTLSSLRKAAWAAAGLAIGIALVAFGAPQVDRLLNVPSRAAVPEPAATSPPRAAEARPLQQVAALPKPTPAIVEPPASAPDSSAIPPAAPAPARSLSAEELTQQLTSLNPDTGARTATEAILRVWGVRPLAADEGRLPDSLEAVAWRRGLQALPITANRSMLRLLDLPALLALRIPGAQWTRLVALTGMDATRAVLAIDGVPVSIDGDLLDRFWSGQANVVWRDFDGLGSVLRRGAKGVAVLHLQELLRRAGTLPREPTGVFEAVTETAVIGFQRSHRLDPDGLVGPLTSIVLYTAGGDYVRPTLGVSKRARS